MEFYTTLSTPVGTVTAVSSGSALTGLWLNDQPQIAQCAVYDSQDPILLAAGEWLKDYFAGNRPDPTSLSLAPSGTPFQELIWGFLRQIPYGEAVTYGELAQKAARHLGREKMSAQAVGGAVGKNPISILIPCHRVLGADGKLTGYAGGLDKKRILLDLECIPYKL